MLEFHEAANVFPMMPDPRFRELVEDIKKHGQLQSILSFDGKILDGRNRYMACVDAGIVPRIEEWRGENPFEFVWSLNGERRDLSDAQRYLCWKAKEEGSEKWAATVRAIKDAGNERRRAAVTKDSSSTSCATTHRNVTRETKADEAKVGRGTVIEIPRGTSKGFLLPVGRAEKLAALIVDLSASKKDAA